jgi:hypothetical protein
VNFFDTIFLANIKTIIVGRDLNPLLLFMGLYMIKGVMFFSLFLVLLIIIKGISASDWKGKELIASDEIEDGSSTIINFNPAEMQ